MHRARAFLLCLGILCLVAACHIGAARAQAQPLGATQVYLEQYRSLHSQLQRLSKRVVAGGDRTAKAAEEVFALTKLVHRLEETVMEPDLQQEQTEGSRRVGLLLVGQACNAMDFELSALRNYIVCGDRSFAGLAREGEALVTSVERHM